MRFDEKEDVVLYIIHCKHYLYSEPHLTNNCVNDIFN